MMNFQLGWFAHAIFVDGQYPTVSLAYDVQVIVTLSSKVMREKIDAKSEAQGFPESRLPSFTEEDSAMILGSSDFLGMNFYTAQVTSTHCYQVLEYNLLDDQIVYPEASDPELVDYNAGFRPLLSLDTSLKHFSPITRPRRGQLPTRHLVRIRILLAEGGTMGHFWIQVGLHHR